jgi:Bifunctional DNA primase/polymerase, N-terminal
LGIITGSRWRLLVLDVDGKQGRRSIHGRESPPTPCVRTHRGFHAWYYYAGPPRATRLQALPGVDILVDGWQIVAPPSMHPNGTAYAWQEPLSLADVALAPAPAWILDLLRPPPTDAPTAAPAVPERRRGQDQSQTKRGDKVYIYSLSPLRGSSSVFPAAAAAGGEGRGHGGGAEVERAPPSSPSPPRLARETWTAGELLELCRKPQVALDCAAVFERLTGQSLRLDRIGAPFRCVLPGHTDSQPSASLWWDQFGMLKYRDWHGEAVQRDREHAGPATWLSLPEVRASLAYGQARWLEEAETWTWQMRLLVEAEIVTPAPVAARPLPRDVRPTVHKVYEGFGLLLGCKGLVKPAEPSAFAYRFAAAWCGVRKLDHVGEAITWLLQHGYMRRVGQHRRTALYQLGAARRDRGERR